MTDPFAGAESMPKAAVRQHILTAIRHTLERDLIGAVQSEDAVATIHLVIRLLDFLGEDPDRAPPSLAGRTGLPFQFVTELNALVGQPNREVREDDLASIGLALTKLLRRADRSSSTQLEAQFLRRLAAHERVALHDLDTHGGGGIIDTYAKGMVKFQENGATVPIAPALTEESLAAVMRASKLFGPEPIVTQLREIPGGFNKLTASFVATHDAIREELIIRRDAAPNPTGFSVVNEFPVLRAVWAAGGVPIAEPLLVEGNSTVLGSPFLIVRRMPGSTDTSHWRSDRAAGLRLAQDLARTLARLHAIDIRAFLPPGEPITPIGDYVAAEVDRWHLRSLQWRIRPSPAIDAGFAWMRANVPRSDREPVFVHGDVGFHNMLMDHGRLTALLDWEFSHIGDPMEDLIYCRPFVTEVCEWPAFLAAYQDAGGVAFDPACEDFFELWPSLRNGSGCDALMRVFLENPGSDLKFAVAGTQHVRRYENAVLEFLGRQPAPDRNLSLARIDR